MGDGGPQLSNLGCSDLSSILKFVTICIWEQTLLFSWISDAGFWYGLDAENNSFNNSAIVGLKQKKDGILYCI